MFINAVNFESVIISMNDNKYINVSSKEFFKLNHQLNIINTSLSDYQIVYHAFDFDSNYSIFDLV